MTTDALRASNHLDYANRGKRLESTIRVFIPGLCKPAGSKRGFYVKKLNRVVITDDCKKSRSWKDTVTAFVTEAYRGDPIDGPLALTLTFHIPRPKGHFGSGKNAANLKPSAPEFPTVKPDVTKLIRAVEDACNGVLWRDDALIVQQSARKIYSSKPGVLLEVQKAFSCPPTLVDDVLKVLKAETQQTKGVA